MAQATEPITLFRDMETKFLAAAVVDERGMLQDARLAEFFDAAEAYRGILSHMGAAVGFILKDVDGNLQGAKGVFMQDPARKASLRSLLQSELEARLHQPGPPAQARLKDPSGACQMQWLLRGFEFFLTMLKLFFEGDGAGAPSRAYAETLSHYHGWVVSMGVKAALLTMPTRESVVRIQAYCPTEPDREKAAALVARDAVKAAEAALPLVLRLIEVYKEMQLWEDRKV